MKKFICLLALILAAAIPFSCAEISLSDSPVHLDSEIAANELALPAHISVPWMISSTT